MESGGVAAAGMPSVPVTGVAIQTSAVSEFISRGRETFGAALSNKRPWSEMVDRSTFAKPESLNDAMGRLRKNLNYFLVNYGILMLVAVALSLLVNPSSIFVIALVLAGWAYLFLMRKEPLVVFGWTFSEREVLLSMTVISLVLIVLSDILSVLLSAGLIGMVLIAAHGAFKVPDDLFLDEQELSGGFLSFLGSGAAGAVPVAVSHV